MGMPKEIEKLNNLPALFTVSAPPHTHTHLMLPPPLS